MELAIDFPAGESFAQRRSKRRASTEIAIGYTLILIVIWTPRPWQQYLWLVATLGIAGMIAASFDGLRAMGLRAANFFRSSWVIAVALACSAVTIWISAQMHTLRTPEGPFELLENFWSYAIWSGVQQFLLQCFFLSRFLRLTKKPGHAAFLAGGLFALAHLPNPVLAVLTIVWGTLACLIFLRYRNLYPLAVAHAILGITIALAIPGPIDHNMRVGLGYLRYHKGFTRPQVQRSQRDQIASTVAWVTADAPTRRSVLHDLP